MKDSFILYTEQKAVIDKLTDEQAGKIIKAIYEYVETDRMPKLDSMLDIIIIPFKQNLDRNREKYNRISEIRARAGAKGGKQKKQMQTNKNKCDDNDNVNENVNDNVNVNENNNVNDSCVDGLQEVIEFYNNNIGSITPFGLEILSDYTKDLNKDIVLYAMQISVEANKRSLSYIKAILNNWNKAGVKTLSDAKNENKNKNNTAEEEFLNE